MKKQVTQSALIAELEAITEEQIKLLISKFQMIREKDLAKKPSEEAWSAAECFEHLTTYGDYYLPKLENAVKLGQRSHPGLVYKPGWLGNWMVNQIKPSPQTKPMKAHQMHLPAANEAPSTHLAKLISQTEHLLQLLQKLQGVQLNRNRIAISIMPMIKLKLGDILCFLVQHQQRHIDQAVRAVEH